MMMTRSQTNKTAAVVAQVKVSKPSSSTKNNSSYNTRSSAVKEMKTEPVAVKKQCSSCVQPVAEPSIILTRSQTKKMNEQTINIDFDEASRYWMRNKRRLGNGTYAYK